MHNETNQELRRIRIVLVIITIIFLFSACDRTVTIEHDPSNQNLGSYFNSNMVPLEDGYFGVLTSDTDNMQQMMKVYFFDKEKKELIFINEKELDDVEMDFEN